MNLLADGNVLGWYQGRFEWGPRALGNRSIIADPRRAEMKEIVNTKIKFREPFRPFAPSVLVDGPPSSSSFPTPRATPARFMLLRDAGRRRRRERLPAVTHVDGSARVQTVHKDHSPLYYDLHCSNFGQATGLPVLLNTSFNLRRASRSSTRPPRRCSTFVRSGMDALVVGHTIVFKDA